MWNANTKFSAVYCRVEGTTVVEHQRLPARETVEEVKADMKCFAHHCNCEKHPRNVPCLRYTKAEPKDAALMDYIDNDRGYRALPYKV